MHARSAPTPPVEDAARRRQPHTANVRWSPTVNGRTNNGARNTNNNNVNMSPPGGLLATTVARGSINVGSGNDSVTSGTSSIMSMMSSASSIQQFGRHRLVPNVQLHPQQQKQHHQQQVQYQAPNCNSTAASPPRAVPNNNGYYNNNANHNTSNNTYTINHAHDTNHRTGIPCDPFSCHPSLSHMASAKTSRRKRQTRALIVLAGVAFVGMLVLDGLTQLNSSNGSNNGVGLGTNDNVGGGGGGGNPNYERGLGGRSSSRGVAQQAKPRGFVRKLVGSFFDISSTTNNDVVVAPSHRLYDNQEPTIANPTSGVYDPNYNRNSNPIVAPTTTTMDGNNQNQQQQQQRALPLLHTFPLLPKYALQHRQRRELMDARKPIPLHLVEGQDDELYHAPHHQRRRMYPMATMENPFAEGAEMKVVDARLVQRRMAGDGAEEEDVDEATLYETGAIYQGYGTHYLDLWVGSPPQRQTVIIDTGSSTTAFPCSKCQHCGEDAATGEQNHLDPDFQEGKSTTYQEATCRPKFAADNDQKTAQTCPLGTCIYEGEDNRYCRLAAMYAEGSSWTAVEGSDIVYPAGPHEVALDSSERRAEEGIGAGMGDIVTDKKPFDWMDFRLTFGCQTKVKGLFSTQLEDGIVGMDNRPGSFWLQLHDHYKKNGYTQEEGNSFDPAQFSLCYDRQPLSLDLRSGVGSGQLTLGGSDPLLHHTPMVFADNITPSEGWYTVRVKGMFLRSNAGSLAEPADNAEYVRVDASEDHLNGNSREGSGIIVDSGTTDTYLSQMLKPAFEKAFKKALKDPQAEYHNMPIELTKEDLKTLPTVMIVLQGHGPSSSKGLQPDMSTSAGMAGHPSHAAMFKKHPDQETTSTFSKDAVVVAIPPEHYMEESRSTPGVYISRIYFTERFGAQNIFGSNFMLGHEVLFDNGMGRVGFAESHCDYEKYISERDELHKTEESRRTNESVASKEAADGGKVDDLHESGWSRKTSESPDGGVEDQLRIPN